MNNTQSYTVPRSYGERSRLRGLIDVFVNDQAPAPPLSMDDLSRLSDKLILDHAIDPEMKGWVMVEINNCAWRETVASIPYEKRILLLPQCLNNSTKCTAEIDELGLLCHKCMSCSIPNLQEEADRLGMMSLVAEGFTSVVGLVESRVVDTVIGVGCLDSLEKAFPLLINNAVPGVAIPLNTSGCKDTHVDFDYVSRMISMQSGKEINLLDYDYLKSTVQEWFTPESLTDILSISDNQTSLIARKWLEADGKRWRPYLLAATYMAVSGEKNIPRQVKLAAVAVECFHKASLVHDDIQDHDSLRYGKQTVNAAYGDSTAINVGDILLGEGYHILSQCGDMELVKVIASTHISLCKGQGMELEWSASPRRLTMEHVLDIFCNKTVPAFEVSLVMGMICAGGDKPLLNVLHDYSRALGIAYQLQDDIEDYETDHPVALRPSAILAVICEQVEDESFIHELFQHDNIKAFLNTSENEPLLQKAILQVKQVAEYYHRCALESLHAIQNMELKRLLFRVTKRILK